MIKLFNNYYADARNIQISILIVFLIIGIAFLHWEIFLLKSLVILVTCLLTQALVIAYLKGNWSTLKSALITALSLIILLKTNFISTAFLISVISIGIKYIFRYNGKHIFNPSNIAIIIGLLFTNDVWVATGQWGSGFEILLLISILGIVVVSKAGRVDTTLTFIVSYFIMQWIRSVWFLHWPVDVMWQTFTGGNILLFSFFMITDPATSPNTRIERIVWAIGIAIVSFVLANFYFVNAAPLWALAIITGVWPLYKLVVNHSKQLSLSKSNAFQKYIFKRHTM